MTFLILYSKPGCHLCEGLRAKLEQITEPVFSLEIRDITQNKEWFNAYQYEVPVLTQALADTGKEVAIPRPSPRLSVPQLQKHLLKAIRAEHHN